MAKNIFRESVNTFSVFEREFKSVRTNFFVSVVWRNQVGPVTVYCRSSGLNPSDGTKSMPGVTKLGLQHKLDRAKSGSESHAKQPSGGLQSAKRIR
jgi:hypothetical protein